MNYMILLLVKRLFGLKGVIRSKYRSGLVNIYSFELETHGVQNRCKLVAAIEIGRIR